MPTYKELFYMKFSNSRGNIKKNTKVSDVWNSMEEFIRLILTPKKKDKKVERSRVSNTIRKSPKTN